MFEKIRTRIQFRNEEGSGLVLALMVFMVLSVLGISLGIVTVGSYKLGDRNRDINSAYYIAETGANLVFEEIRANITDIYQDSSNESIFFNKINDFLARIKLEYGSDTFSLQFGRQPKASVTISGPEDNGETKKYKIKSTGSIDNNSRVVEKEFEVAWIEKKGGVDTIPPIPEGTAVISKSSTSFTGGSIKGDIYAMADSKNSFEVGHWGTLYNVHVYSGYTGSNLDDIYYPETAIKNTIKNVTSKGSMGTPWSAFENMLSIIEVPNTSGYNIISGGLSVGPWPNVNWSLSGNTFINGKLSVSQGGMLSIQTGAAGQETNLVVKSLEMPQGFIRSIGEGSLHIHVLDSISILGGSKINDGGNLAKLRLYYYGSGSVSLGGSTLVNGNLLVEKAKIDLGGSGAVTGAIISGGSELSISGGSFNNSIMILPNPGSTIKLTNGSVTGVLLSDKLKMSNGNIIFDYFDPGILFPNSTGQGSGSGTVSLEELIFSRPAKEKTD